MTMLAERFRTHVERHGLFPAAGPAVVAVSGGADSVALLDLLAGAGPALGLQLVVAHADHGIRSDSRTVGESVRELARRYDLPFELGELGLGPRASETVARRARYTWLGDVKRRRRARYLVTAHHLDDQIETILLRVLRGSGPAGLAGMPARARGGLVRPLLAFTRAELAAHVAARGLPVHDDPANRDPRHLRSWVRLALLPLLVQRLGERVRRDVLRLGAQAATERRAWERVAELLPELGFRRTADGFEVARGPLADYDDRVAAALVRAAARRVGLVLGPARAGAVLGLARRPSGRRLPLGRGWTAEVAFDRLLVRAAVERAAAVTEPVMPSGERGSAAFGPYRLSWRPEPAPAALERRGWVTWVSGTGWELRPYRSGDKVVPLGGVGHRPVRRLLMEARVPRSERSAYPVLARGETILWVPGICRSDEELPAPGTAAVRVDVTKHGAAEADGRA